MQTDDTPTLERPHRAMHADLANEHSDVLRSRHRPLGKLPSVPGYIGTRYNTEGYLYLKGSNFSGGPPIFIGDDKGQRRLANDGDYEGKPLTASESKGSEESSIHKVDDLGFEAAAANFPAFPRGSSDCDSVLSNSIEDIFRQRELSYEFCSEKPLRPTSIQDRLRDRIEEALVWSALDKQDYLPLDRLESILDVESIALLLKEIYHLTKEEELREKFANIVDTETGRCRRRILGVLVFMSRVEYIDNFIREDIWDIHLPLERSASIVNRHVRTRTSDNEFTLENWSRDEIELFCLYQKMFFVPFFDIKEDRLCSYELESNIRLPYMSFEHKTSGGFGVIHKVEIHPSHHNFARSNVSQGFLSILPSHSNLHSLESIQYSL